MGLLGTRTEEAYYNQSQSFTGDGSTTSFTITTSYFTTRPTQQADIDVYINNKIINKSTYTYNGTSPSDTSVDNSYNIVFHNTSGVNSDLQESSGAPKSGLKIVFIESTSTEEYGNYQHISINDIINNFMVSYVGDDKIINRVKKSDVAFHAQRGIQELSYDTLKSIKSQEIEIPPSLNMILPQDYINYVKLTYSDAAGVEKILYPARNTSNPQGILQDSDYRYLFDVNGKLQTSFNSLTWDKFSNSSTVEASKNSQLTSDELDLKSAGKRFGITPEYAQNNGSFFIDELKGIIYFSSNISSRIVTLKYISDGLAKDSDMVVHKFAEEAIYKHIAHAVLASKTQVPEYIVNRFKKERFAEKRKAKLRLSNLKSEELTQIMRNKSKQIKH
tara:strand:- start:3907 stop:5073 length:1167 start_codon:yes stop_codon:yes gene_type:complete